jgi:aminoacrylate hydrolase
VELLASDLAALLEHLNLSGAALVGHSTGGAIGQVLAARSPARVSRLILYASWAKLCPQMRQCMEVRQQLLQQGGAAAYHRASPLFLYPPRYICETWPAIEQEIAGTAAQSPTSTILEARLRAVVDYEGADYLPRITAPTQILVAQDDFLTPPVASEFLAERIRGAELHVMAYGGHAVSRTMPAAFNAAVLDFLAAAG